jgi:hypothetical protein
MLALKEENYTTYYMILYILHMHAIWELDVYYWNK